MSHYCESDSIDNKFVLDKFLLQFLSGKNHKNSSNWKKWVKKWQNSNQSYLIIIYGLMLRMVISLNFFFWNSQIMKILVNDPGYGRNDS